MIYQCFFILHDFTFKQEFYPWREKTVLFSENNEKYTLYRYSRFSISSFAQIVLATVLSNYKIPMQQYNTVKPFNSRHLRVLKNLSVIKRCPLFGGSLKEIITFGAKYFVRYSRHVRYLRCPLMGGLTVYSFVSIVVMAVRVSFYLSPSFSSSRFQGPGHQGPGFKSPCFQDPGLRGHGPGFQYLLQTMPIKKTNLWVISRDQKCINVYNICLAEKTRRMQIN